MSVELAAEAASRHATPVDRQRSLLEKSALIRAVEQRLLRLFSEGKLFGTVHTCIGQEYVGVAIADNLRPGDLIFSNHRCHGHFLARTDDVHGLIAEIMGKQTGVCGGRGGSQHLCSEGFYSNGIQGGIVPVSAGLAFGQKLRGERGAITVVFIGDGTLGEGAVYESLNVASKWELPLLVVLENNLYSQSTSQPETLSGDIQARAQAFGIQSRRASTWELEDLADAASHAVNYVRDEGKPFFLRVDTYRLMAHSKGDDDRDPAEVQGYWQRDPLAVFEKERADDAARINAEIGTRIEQAVAKAETAHYSTEWTPPSSGNGELLTKPLTWTQTKVAKADRCVNLIREALKRNMQRDARIVVIGEDIRSPYGGAFKATKGLSDEFPDRVRNTPIAESLIVGMGNGLALGGMIPVCELMFGDFIALAADQLINHASKFRYMYNDQVRVPLVVRTPMGGKRGYGPTHSQSIEKHFLGMPQTRVIALHNRFDPGVIYDTIFATIEDPTIVIENKLLYSLRVSDEMPPGYVLEHTSDPFPTTRIRPEGEPDLTILCYGGMLGDVETAVQEAFENHELICEVICPTQLYPLDVRPVLQSVASSGRLLVVEEGVSFAAFGAEVVAKIVELAPDALRAVKRLASPEHPIPSCGPLEKQVLPNPSSILGAIVEVTSR